MRDPYGMVVVIPLAVEDAITEAARATSVRPSLLMGLAWKESSYLWWAAKFEPGYPYLWDVKNNKPTRVEAETGALGICSPATELQFQRTSLGVCQVMGATAREFGFREALLTRLLDVKLGATYGAKYLASLLARHKGDESDAVSAYNAGAPTDKNFNAYVSPVLTMAETYRRERGGL